MTKKPTYTSGKVSEVLLKNSIPMVFGIGAAIAFSFIDTVFVAKLGVDQLAAITFTFPVVFLVFGVAMGLGQGASAVISKAYGEGDHQRVKRLTTDSIVLSLIAVAIFTSLGIIFFDETFKVLGAEDFLMPYISEYMMIWFSGIIFLVVPLIGNSAIRAIGDTKTPSMIMMIAVLVNLILDPLLIFGYWIFPEMGMAGAATATLFARFVTLIASFYFLTKKYDLLDFNLRHIVNCGKSWKSILDVGLPSALTNILIPIGISIIIKFVSEFGTEAVAAFGAASRVEMVTLAVFMALASVVGPFIGQNWGAKKPERIFQALRNAYQFAILWGIAMIALFYLGGRMIAEFIKDDPKVVEYMVMYFRISSLAIAFRGIIMMTSTSFNVLGKPKVSALLSISQMFLIFIPLAIYLANSFGIEGIFTAALVSAVIVSIISYFWLEKHLQQKFLETSS
jgi:MATE family, multidrug efflux pump